MLARASSLQDEVVEAYRKYEFHLIYQKVHDFCVVELGAFWLDIIKDRLYTTPRQGVARRSAQTAMYHIAEAMVRWLAPILSFTAEEIWQFLPGQRDASVFFSTWWKLPEVHGKYAVDWDAVIALKADVARELERLRTAGALGAPLEAAVDVYLDEAQHRRMAALGDELRFVLITSQARMRPAAERPADAAAASSVADGPGPGSRSPWIRRRSALRCWHRRADVGVRSGRTRRSADAASRTSAAPAKRGISHDPARDRQASTALIWAWLSAIVVALDQFVKWYVVGNFGAVRDPAGRALPRPHAPAQRGRGFQAPRERGRLAALVLPQCSPARSPSPSSAGCGRCRHAARRGSRSGWR